MIYANYDDGAGGVTQVLLFDAPGAPKTAEETGFPEAKSTVAKNPEIIPALSMDHMWARTGDRSQIRSLSATLWTFANPLPLDSSKALSGFTFAVYNQDSWRARRALMYAASANRVAVPTLSSALKSAAIAEDGSSVLSTYNNQLKKLNAQGTQLWSLDLGLIAGKPQIAQDGRVFVGSSNTSVYGLDPAGNIAWSFVSQGALAGLRFNNDESELLAVTGNGWLYALDLDGNVLWEINIGLPPDSKVIAAPTLSPPTAPTDHIYIKDNQGRLYAIEPALPLQSREASVQWVR
jgi:outer membrane protein assembly factor BamB